MPAWIMDLPASEILAVLTAVMFVVCGLAARVTQEADDAFVLAQVVSVLTAVTVLMSAALPLPWRMANQPVEDLLVLTFVLAAYKSKPEHWKIDLAIILIALLFWHTLFWVTGDFSNHAQRGYIAGVNFGFGAELLILSLAGAGHVWRNRTAGPALSWRRRLADDEVAQR